MNKYTERLYNGIIKENPTFILLLGMCPTLAVSTQAMNGIGMGLSTTAVLILSNMVISALRKVIPDQVRLPAYIVVVASLVTVTELVIEAYLPSLYKALGIYIPLIVVNCIILGRAEAFANKNSVVDSALDGLGLGLGYTCALTIMACIRELLGAGTIFGHVVTANLFSPMSIFVLAPGGFFTFGCIIAALNKLTKGKNREKQAENKCLGCPGAEACHQAVQGGR